MTTEVDTFLEFQKELFNEEQCFKIFEKSHAYFDNLSLVSLINLNVCVFFFIITTNTFLF